LTQTLRFCKKLTRKRKETQTKGMLSVRYLKNLTKTKVILLGGIRGYL
jgi:2-phosphoglycerate kinase